MDGSTIFGIETGIPAGACDLPVGKTDLRAFELLPSLGRFCAVLAHGVPFPTYRHAAVDGKVIFVNGRLSPVGIEGNERDNAVVAAVFIVRHCIMCGVQKELCYVCFRQELFHGIPVVKETNGVMPGSGAKEREDGQVVLRIRGGI